MDDELRAAVERLTAVASSMDRIGEPQRANDIRLVLASLQAPCPGKVGELREKVAREICLVHGQEPDDIAPTGMICGSNNEPLPMWEFYGEDADAALSVVALLSAQPVPSDLLADSQTSGGGA